MKRRTMRPGLHALAMAALLGAATLPATSAETDWAAEISASFQQLGMVGARAQCYGEALAAELSPEDQREAARVVSESADADEVKTNVVTGGPDMIGAFSAADVACPEDMGG